MKITLLQTLHCYRCALPAALAKREKKRKQALSDAGFNLLFHVHYFTKRRNFRKKKTYATHGNNLKGIDREFRSERYIQTSAAMLFGDYRGRIPSLNMTTTVLRFFFKYK